MSHQKRFASLVYDVVNAEIVSTLYSNYSTTSKFLNCIDLEVRIKYMESKGGKDQSSDHRYGKIWYSSGHIFKFLYEKRKR